MSHRNQRRTLPTAVCAQALHAGCPRASTAHAGMSRSRSRWLRVTCALACRCTARFRALLMLLGAAGIAGFTASGAGFVTGLLNEAQYLSGVAASLCVFVVSVLIAHLGDPYELQRSECQRATASVRRLSLSETRARLQNPDRVANSRSAVL